MREEERKRGRERELKGCKRRTVLVIEAERRYGEWRAERKSGTETGARRLAGVHVGPDREGGNEMKRERNDRKGGIGRLDITSDGGCGSGERWR